MSETPPTSQSALRIGVPDIWNLKMWSRPYALYDLCKYSIRADQNLC